MKYLFLGLLASFLLACNPKKQTDKSVEITVTKNSTNDSLSIDLLEIQTKKQLGSVQQVTVQNDPVYHKQKKFNVVNLKTLMEAHSTVENLQAADYKVVFECEDGYKPEMSLAQLLNAKAFLAFSDAEAPTGRDWEQIMKDGHEMKAAPFYVVYEGVNPKDGSYKWPYNLVKIHFAPANENEAALKPTVTEAMLGYNLFKKHCQTCHALNGIGGVMGPELNYPKNITEYWKKQDLEAFIVNPAAYRNGVKMPNLNIKPTESIEIVKYLEHMAGRKKL